MLSSSRAVRLPLRTCFAASLGTLSRGLGRGDLRRPYIADEHLFLRCHGSRACRRAFSWGLPWHSGTECSNLDEELRVHPDLFDDAGRHAELVAQKELAQSIPVDEVDRCGAVA